MKKIKGFFGVSWALARFFWGCAVDRARGGKW
jgi:hypothetical protein